MKSISKPALAWTLVVPLLLAGYLTLKKYDLPGTALMFLVAAALLAPPMKPWLERALKRKLPENVCWGAAFILAITACLMMSAHEEAEADRMVNVTTIDEENLLCVDPEVFDALNSAKDPTNERLERELKRQPEAYARYMTSDDYFRRVHAAVDRATKAAVSDGRCVELPIGSPLQAARKHVGLANTPRELDRVPVTYQGRHYWTYAGSMALAESSTLAPR